MTTKKEFFECQGFQRFALSGFGVWILKLSGSCLTKFGFIPFVCVFCISGAWGPFETVVPKLRAFSLAAGRNSTAVPPVAV